MKFKNTTTLLIFAAVAVSCFLFMLVTISRKQNTVVPTQRNQTSLLNLPSDWKLKIEDNTNCYSVNLTSKGFINETAEAYVKGSMNLSSLDGVIDSSSSLNTTPNIIVTKQMGVENVKNIYIKSSDGKLYLVEVNLSGQTRKTGSFCNDINKILPNIIESLQ